MNRGKQLFVLARLPCVPVTHIRMVTMKHARLAALASSAATLLLVSSPAAQANQCSAEKPRDAQSWWSWRIIEGRKCWYEGKPKLPKSLLQWDEQAPAQNESDEGILTTEKDINDNALDGFVLRWSLFIPLEQ